jgi:hypothetical protein
MKAMQGKSEATPIAAQASGSHFYKYSEFTAERQEWLKEIILGSQLYVPSVTQLNDPADGRPRLARQSEDDLYRFLYNSPCGVLGRNPHMTIEEQVREAVVLDANIRKHGAEQLQRVMAKYLNDLLGGYRIYSLSKRFNNLSLWAKYAGNHSGYCLEYANKGPFFGCAREVIYGESVQMDINNPAHLNGYWLFCKDQEWSNEEEVRIIVPPRLGCKVRIAPSQLTRVILGWKMPKANRKIIREWAKQRTPELTVVSAYFDEYEQSLNLSRQCPATEF